MKEAVGNLWDYYTEGGYIVITTNGTIKANGECVMGRGCALEAKTRFPSIPATLGKFLKQHGNQPCQVHDRILTLPVKHNWYEKADLKLIEHSLIKLLEMVDAVGLDLIYMPRPGCGNGHLDWETQVKPVCRKYLDDRFIVLTKE